MERVKNKADVAWFTLSSCSLFAGVDLNPGRLWRQMQL